MDKIDPKKLFKEFYNPKQKFDIVEVPKLQFLAITGKGNPNISQDYKETLEALYSVSYGLKFHSKKKYQKDYVIGPLEGLWWADDMNDFITRKKDNWLWQMQIWQPEWILQSDFEEVLNNCKIKKPNTKLDFLKFIEIKEGLCVQILHIGSYDDEAPILDKLHNEFIPQNGFKIRGIHHEIYLSDPRKTRQEKLKTILRQPVLKE